MEKFFNNYNFKSRFVAVIIMCSPLLWSAMICIPQAQSISGISVLLVILLSVSSLLCVVARRLANKAAIKIFSGALPTTELLLNSNEYINEETRIRYNQKLSNYCDINLNSVKNCNTAIDWLRSNYHQSTRAEITDEENTTYGFCLTLYAIKLPSLCVCILNMLLLSILYCCDYITLPLFMACGIYVIICVFLWLFCVTKRLVQFAGRKYALALLSCLDCLNKNGSNAINS